MVPIDWVWGWGCRGRGSIPFPCTVNVSSTWAVTAEVASASLVVPAMFLSTGEKFVSMLTGNSSGSSRDDRECIGSGPHQILQVLFTPPNRQFSPVRFYQAVSSHLPAVVRKKSQHLVR